MKSVLTHVASIQSCTDGTFYASVYILCIDKLLKELERRFEDFEHMKFTVSFVTNMFQERDISESAELKENVSELELEIINLQTDIPLKKRVNDTNFRNLVLSVQCSILK
jgi:hypothetical protein